jgi:hypothetical protein
MAGRHGLAADGQPAVEIAVEGQQQDGGLDPFAFIWQWNLWLHTQRRLFGDVFGASI